MNKDISKVDELALRAFEQAMNLQDASLKINGLLTPGEKNKIGRRILIAQAIMAGKTRHEVNNHLSVSPNTFAQIHRWLENELDQYHSSYKKENQTIKTVHKVMPRTFSLEHLQKMRPGHFLLVSLVDELFKIKRK